MYCRRRNRPRNRRSRDRAAARDHASGMASRPPRRCSGEQARTVSGRRAGLAARPARAERSGLGFDPLGEVAERSNAAVSKTVIRHTADRGFKSLPLRYTSRNPPRTAGFVVSGPVFGWYSVTATDRLRPLCGKSDWRATGAHLSDFAAHRGDGWAFSGGSRS